jgi:hypothetical protein
MSMSGDGYLGGAARSPAVTLGNGLSLCGIAQARLEPSDGWTIVLDAQIDA